MQKPLIFIIFSYANLSFCAASSSDPMEKLEKQILTKLHVSPQEIPDTHQSQVIPVKAKGRKITNPSPLLRAAVKGDDDQVIILCEHHDPNLAESTYGTTPLMHAAIKGHYDVVKTLLGMTLDKEDLLTRKSIDGKCALDYAKSNKHEAIIKFLTIAQNKLTYGPLCKTYFSPNILDAVMNCIKNEQKSIHCAMYHFTLGKPAKAFVKRAKAGVTIDLIIDKAYPYNPSRKSFDPTKKTEICLALRYMINNGIEIRECTMGSNHDTNNGHFNMHNKFLVFGKNTGEKPLLITGSYNFTHQGTIKNWENIVMLDNQTAIDSFLRQHDLMKKTAMILPIARCKSDKDTDRWAIENNRLEKLR